jgi:hypothetical protein
VLKTLNVNDINIVAGGDACCCYSFFTTDARYDKFLIIDNAVNIACNNANAAITTYNIENTPNVLLYQISAVILPNINHPRSCAINCESSLNFKAATSINPGHWSIILSI